MLHAGHAGACLLLRSPLLLLLLLLQDFEIAWFHRDLMSQRARQRPWTCK
jgi:hypothetical protein